MRKMLSLGFAILVLAGCGEEKAPPKASAPEAPPATAEAKPADTAKPAEAAPKEDAKDK